MLAMLISVEGAVLYGDAALLAEAKPKSSIFVNSLLGNNSSFSSSYGSRAVLKSVEARAQTHSAERRHSLLQLE